jgi:MEMO1 family protein
VPADLQGARTRAPAVAGLFYPRDPVRLQTEVLELLGGDAPASKVVPKALIAPHAGYVYSGRVAGVAFAKLRASAQTITRVVLIGPAHYVHLGGIAAPRVEAFETPLGRVRVDTETCSQIGRFEFVTQTDAPHEPEHALEVELPFPADGAVILQAGAARCGRRGSAGGRAPAAPIVGWTGDADRR